MSDAVAIMTGAKTPPEELLAGLTGSGWSMAMTGVESLAGLIRCQGGWCQRVTWLPLPERPPRANRRWRKILRDALLSSRRNGNCCAHGRFSL